MKDKVHPLVRHREYVMASILTPEELAIRWKKLKYKPLKAAYQTKLL